MTEHAAVIFVFFFLAEYASIVLICILTSILFLGGYLVSFAYIVYLIKEIDSYLYISTINYYHETFLSDPLIEIDPYLYISTINYDHETFLSDPLIEGMIYGLTLGFKTCTMIFVFIWARASFPRIRYDQLMSFC